MSGGKTRFVRCERGTVGIVVGPATELDTEIIAQLETELRYGTPVKVIPPHLEQESVCWWNPGSRRWSSPVAAWTLELETVPATHKGALGWIVKQIETKLRADKGLRVGSDDNQATWYAVNSALGI